MDGQKSHRSVRSVKSLLVSELNTDSKRVLFEDPCVLPFEDNLKEVCLNYQAPFELRVKRDTQRSKL